MSRRSAHSTSPLVFRVRGFLPSEFRPSTSNLCIFKHFRTLSQPEARLTPFSSIASALFAQNTGGGARCSVSPLVYPERSRRVTRLSRAPSRGHSPLSLVASILPYTLPSYVGSKFFVCHSYENCRGVGLFFPFWKSLPTAKNAATRETLQRFNVPTFRRSNGSNRTVLLQTLLRSDRMAVYALGRSKCQETKPLPLVSKNKESGQRVRQGLSPGPGKRIWNPDKVGIFGLQVVPGTSL